MTLRVGVTAVGSGIAHAIVQSCRMMAEVPFLVGFDASPLAFDAYDCDESHLVPDSRSPEYAAALLAACAERKIDVLIPGLDHDLSALAPHAERFAAEGTVVIVGGAEFVRLCRDKVAWSQELSAVCPAVVPAWTPEELPAAFAEGKLTFPLLAKPCEGSGSVGVKVLNGPADYAGLHGPYVIQPFVFPRAGEPAHAAVTDGAAHGRIVQAGEISFQLVYGGSGRLMAKMASRNRLKAGVPVEILPVDDGPYYEALLPALAFLLERGMRGPVNFQGRMTDAGPRFFEMNGRFTGITALRAMLGFNEVEAVVGDFLGLRPAHALRINPRKLGLRQVVDRVVDVDTSPALRERAAALRGKSGAAREGLAVAVTGANGWLGRHLVTALLAEDGVRQVTALVRDTEAAAKLWPASTRLRLARIESLVAEIAGADLVYHLGFARPGNSPAELASSVELTRKLTAAMQRTFVSRYVFASSQAVYGSSSGTPWSESLPLAPETPYAMAKIAGEQLAALLKEASPSSLVTSVRLGRLYGAVEGLRWSEVPHLFAARSADGEPITVRGGDQVYELIHVRDAVQALLQFARLGPRSWAPAYNLGGGTVTLLEIGRAAVEAAQRSGVKAASLERTAPEGPDTRISLDSSLFRQQTGWEPAVPLTTAMAELVALARARPRH